jgi:hypothetical protein
MFGINNFLGPMIGRRLDQSPQLPMAATPTTGLARFLNRPAGGGSVTPIPGAVRQPMLPQMPQTGVALPGAGGHRALNPLDGIKGGGDEDLMEMLRRLFGGGGGMVGYQDPSVGAAPGQFNTY